MLINPSYLNLFGQLSGAQTFELVDWMGRAQSLCGPDVLGPHLATVEGRTCSKPDPATQ